MLRNSKTGEFTSTLVEVASGRMDGDGKNDDEPQMTSEAQHFILDDGEGQHKIESKGKGQRAKLRTSSAT